jgi:KaiC/GvpD/RAD55 family RecA-like ATPase
MTIDRSGRSGLLIQQIVRHAKVASHAVGIALLGAEEILRFGRIGAPPSGVRARAEDLSPDQFLGLLMRKWNGESVVRSVLARLEQPQDSLVLDERRLAGLILQAWVRETSAKAARRPDVLHLTCQFLSNPTSPHSYPAVRYGLILALRAAYGCDYTARGVEELRQAYDRLRIKFDRQQRRRQPKRGGSAESFLIDLLSLEGWVRRSATRTNLGSYYASFGEHPFGVLNQQRLFAGPEWPELNLVGSFPDFPALLNLAYSQPIALPGFDDVTGGFMPAIPTDQDSLQPEELGEHAGIGSLVTLIAGPPGSGKTSLTLALTSRMAELGSIVRYIATEELKESLETKVRAIAEPGAAAWWRFQDVEDRSPGDLTIVDGSRLRSLAGFVETLRGAMPLVDEKRVPSDPELYPVFPRVIAIDSLTTLLQHGSPEESDGQRSALNQLLNNLRGLGVCVFLVGSLDDIDRNGLDYLVDNIITLDFEPERSHRHPIRVLNVQKTRLQTSDRGRHVWHLSRHDGCTVSPSLHSVLRSLKGRTARHNDPRKRAVMWSWDRTSGHQPALPGVESIFPEPLTISDCSHTVIYGSGSSGKAAFALASACEPRMSVVPTSEWNAYLHSHSDRRRSLRPFEVAFHNNLQVLVVSFLYGPEYYRTIATRLFRQRFNSKRGQAKKAASERISVLSFYPGYIDPESIIAKVRRELNSARLGGRRYTTVVIDGIHNLLLQFPLAQNEVLLWPTLNRLLRDEGVSTISTFTFFRAMQLSPMMNWDGRREWEALGAVATRLGPTAAEELFFHLLVTSCDYSFVVERPLTSDPTAEAAWVRVRLASSVDGTRNQGEDFWWDNNELRYRHLVVRDGPRRH